MFSDLDWGGSLNSCDPHLRCQRVWPRPVDNGSGLVLWTSLVVSGSGDSAARSFVLEAAETISVA